MLNLQVFDRICLLKEVKNEDQERSAACQFLQSFIETQSFSFICYLL